VGAVATVHQVRVAVDQTGGDKGTTGIVLHGAARQQVDGQVSTRADPGQGLGVHYQSCVFQQSIGLPSARHHRGGAAMGPQFQAHADTSIQSAWCARTSTVADSFNVRQTSVDAGTSIISASIRALALESIA